MKNILQRHSDNTYTFAHIDASGAVLTSHKIETLQDIPAIHLKQPWYLFIPGEQVLTLSLQMPKMKRRELHKAIPFALEDRLITDLDKLHFALGLHDEDGKVTVAVIDKLLLDSYQKELQFLHSSLKAIIPEFLAVPYNKGEWTIQISDGKVHVRTQYQSGFTTSLENLELLLNLTLDKNEYPPNKVVIYNEHPLAKDYFQILRLKLIPVETYEGQDASFNYSKILKNPPFNVISNHYGQGTRKSGKIYWRMAFATAMLCMASFFGLQWVKLVDLQKKVELSQQHIQTLAERALPGIHDLNNPRPEIERELTHLTQNLNEMRFITLLSRAAETFKNNYQNVEIRSINYDNDQLTIQVSTADLSHLESLVRELHEKGLTVDQKQMTHQDKKISAEVVIR